MGVSVSVVIASVEIDHRVLTRLLEKPPVGANDLVVLPTRVRPSGAWYSFEDAETLAAARKAGFNARPLDPEPEFLDEFAADWVTDLAVSFGGGVGVLGVQALGTLLWHRAKGALAQGLVHGQPTDVPARLTLVVRRDADGSEFRAVSIEGTTQAVIDDLGSALSRLEQLAAVTRDDAQPTPSTDEGARGRVDGE